MSVADVADQAEKAQLARHKKTWDILYFSVQIAAIIGEAVSDPPRPRRPPVTTLPVDLVEHQLSFSGLDLNGVFRFVFVLFFVLFCLFSCASLPKGRTKTQLELQQNSV